MLLLWLRPAPRPPSPCSLADSRPPRPALIHSAGFLRQQAVPGERPAAAARGQRRALLALLEAALPAPPLCAAPALCSGAGMKGRPHQIHALNTNAPPPPSISQSTFISIINPGASVIQVLEWTLLNSAVALVGYYFAAFTIDRPWMGRMRMQNMGFAW